MTEVTGIVFDEMAQVTSTMWKPRLSRRVDEQLGFCYWVCQLVGGHVVGVGTSMESAYNDWVISCSVIYTSGAFWR